MIIFELIPATHGRNCEKDLEFWSPLLALFFFYFAACLLPFPTDSLPWPWFLSTRQFWCSIPTPWPFSLYRYWLSHLKYVCFIGSTFILVPLIEFLISPIPNLWQQLATTLLIHFGRVMGYTKAKDFNMATAKKLLPVSVFYNANVAFALASLKGVNIPMYIALKRLTPLAVLVAGSFSGKARPPTQVRDLYASLLWKVRMHVPIGLSYFQESSIADLWQHFWNI